MKEERRERGESEEKEVMGYEGREEGERRSGRERGDEV